MAWISECHFPYLFCYQASRLIQPGCVTSGMLKVDGTIINIHLPKQSRESLKGDVMLESILIPGGFLLIYLFLALFCFRACVLLLLLSTSRQPVNHVKYH